MAWTKPPLRPLGPNPQRSASSTTIRGSPGSASSRCHAVHRPGEPAADDDDVGVGVLGQRRQRRRRPASAIHQPWASCSISRRRAAARRPACRRPWLLEGDAGWPSWPSSDRSRPKSELDVPVDEQAQLALDAGHHREVVACGPAAMRAARASDARSSRPPPRPGPCRRTRPTSGSVNGRTRPVAERRGDVARDAPALAHARAGRSAGDGALALLRRVGHRRGVADRPHVRPALDPHRLVDARSGRGRRAAGPRRSTTGWGRTPAVHTHVRVGTTSPSLRRAVVAVSSSSVVSVRISIPRPRSSRTANSASVGRDLGHHAVGRLDEDPAHPLGAAARIALDRVGGEVLQLGEPLEPGVARADEDVVSHASRSAGSSSVSAASSVRSSAVAQLDRVGQRLEAEAVLGEPRDRQRARDRRRSRRRAGRRRAPRRGPRATAGGSCCGPGRRRRPRRSAGPCGRAPRAAGRRRGAARACPPPRREAAACRA